MRPKPQSCSGCALQFKGQGYADTDGLGRNGVLVVAEALGEQEARRSTPLVGDAGFQWNRTLKRIGVPRDDFLMTNVVRCRPPNNWLEGAPWEHSAISHCDQYLLHTINEMKPKVILPMGNVAMRSIIGKRGIESLRGYVYDALIAEHACYVVPTYHPAFILRGKDNLTGINIFDIQRALKVSREGYREPQVNYIENPTHSDLELYLRDAKNAAYSGKPIVSDIETPRSGSTSEDEYGEIVDADILRISFSFQHHTGITCRWTQDNMWFILAMFELPWCWVIWWNKEFDVPRIISKGVSIRSRNFDAMEMWRWCQSDVPHGLGVAASLWTEVREWKSLSEQYPEFYSVKDSDVTLQCYDAIRAQLIKEGRFQGFLRDVFELDPLLKDIGGSGVLIDQAHRAEFKAKLEAELRDMESELQREVPDVLRKRKYRTRWPEDAEIGKPVRASANDGAYWAIDANGEWYEQFDFKPSSQQMVAYMKSQKHPVPKNHKTDADTTGATELEKLSKKFKGDRVYPLVLKIRGHQKLITQYLGDKKSSYAPDPDGRVRTNFGFKPKTSRLNSYNPNMTNVIKRKDIAYLYRQQFVPAKGHVLVEIDFNAGEPTLVGHFADDPNYMEAARVGVHAVFASHVLNGDGRFPIIDPFGDKELAKAQVKELKSKFKDIYNTSKRICNGSNNGETPYKMHMDFPEEFPFLQPKAAVSDWLVKNCAVSKGKASTLIRQHGIEGVCKEYGVPGTVLASSAEWLHDMYFNTLARKVRAWHKRILELAERRHFLENPFKARHYFWEILRWDMRRGAWVPGNSANQALAFMQQSSLRFILTRSVQRIASKSKAIKDMMRLLVHDSLLLEIPRGNVDDVVRECVDTMQAPIDELDGLWIGVDAEASDRSWADVKEWEPNMFN